jgi:hypothetical protein
MFPSPLSVSRARMPEGHTLRTVRVRGTLTPLPNDSRLPAPLPANNPECGWPDRAPGTPASKQAGVRVARLESAVHLAASGPKLRHKKCDRGKGGREGVTTDVRVLDL